MVCSQASGNAVDYAQTFSAWIDNQPDAQALWVLLDLLGDAAEFVQMVALGGGLVVMDDDGRWGFWRDAGE